MINNYFKKLYVILETVSSYSEFNYFKKNFKESCKPISYVCKALKKYDAIDLALARNVETFLMTVPS